MNHAYVIDASVALKWFFQEDFSEQARNLFIESRRNRRPLYGPPVIVNEVTNAIYQRLRRRRVNSEEANDALQGFFAWPVVEVVSLPRLYQRAYTFARDHQLPDIYDSVYIILGQMLDAEVWTDDRRLINNVGSDAPWVRWIGNYQS